jgi:ribokinase
MRPSGDIAADVLVVGDALLDVYAAPSEPMRPGGDVPAAVRVGPGGQGANVAVRLARQGLTVRLACALGDDASGRLVGEALEADGVELDAASAGATGAVVILVAPDGERTMLSRRLPLLPRTAGPAPWTVVSGYALLEDGDLRLTGPGRVAILGCAMPAGTEGTWRKRVEDARPDLVVLNAEEARALEADPTALAMAWGARVVITGPDGASAVGADPDVSPRRATVQRAPSVDTTGAGDAFAAAFLAELHDLPAWADGDIDRALAAGLALAAQVAGVAGAQAPVDGERPA